MVRAPEKKCTTTARSLHVPRTGKGLAGVRWHGLGLPWKLSGVKASQFSTIYVFAAWTGSVRQCITGGIPYLNLHTSPPLNAHTSDWQRAINNRVVMAWSRAILEGTYRGANMRWCSSRDALAACMRSTRRPDSRVCLSAFRCMHRKSTDIYRGYTRRARIYLAEYCSCLTPRQLFS